MNLTICCIVDKLTEKLLEKLKKYEIVSHKLLVVVNEGENNLNTGNVQVISKDFNNNFAELRNFALSQIKTSWVLFLDSDEELSEQLIGEIPKLITANDVDGYWISRRTYISPNRYLRYGLFYPDFQLRLFRVRPDYKFKGAIHEVVNIPQNKTSNIKLDILHFPRNPKYTKFSDFKNLLPYIKIDVERLKRSESKRLTLVCTGIQKCITIFVGGFFRGKGFLDGWDGFRAHVLFSLSIGLPYILAAQSKQKT